jgi:flagellar motility protein MotE (MotC chaperone)
LQGVREENKVLRKELAAVREENGEARKELAAVREDMRGREEKWQAEETDWMKRIKMIEEKIKQREKKERKNNVIITGIRGIRGNIVRGVEEW